MWERTRGRGPAARRWTGEGSVTIAARLAHSSVAFAKRLSGGDHAEEGVPTSSVADRGIVVGWGPNEKSQLYVAQCLTCLWC